MQGVHYLYSLGAAVTYFLLGSGFAQAQTAPAPKPPLPLPSQSQSVTVSAGVAMLETDKRLDALVSVHEIGTNLRDVLAEVGGKDVPLSADATCAEQKLHIRLKQRPVRVLMQTLAELLPGEWHQREDNGGYGFSMTSRAARRRDRWWDLFLGERERAFAAMRAASLQAMRARPKPPKRFITNHAVEDGMDEETWREIANQKTFFNLLPAELQEQVASQINPDPWYESTMDGAVGIGFSSGLQSGAFLLPANALPNEAYALLGSIGRPSNSANNVRRDDLYVQFQNAGLILGADVIGPDGKVLRCLGMLDVALTPDMLPIGLDHTLLAKEVKKRGKDAPLAWKELAVYQESHVWPNDRPAKVPREYPSRASTLEALADTADMEFVSDYYSKYSDSLRPAPDKQPRPLKAELDLLAAERDLSWKRTGGNVILMRNNRWYRDDRLEIPDRLAKRWLAYKAREVRQEKAWEAQHIKPDREAWAARQRAQLDWLVEVVTTLTPWQIWNGLYYLEAGPEQVPLTTFEEFVRQKDPRTVNRERHPFALEFDSADSIEDEYRALLFCAGLSAEERDALMQGRLNFASLTPDQQAQTRFNLPLLQFTQPNADQPLLLGTRPAIVSWPSRVSTHLIITSPSIASQK
jgi:hypothetical protein